VNKELRSAIYDDVKKDLSRKHNSWQLGGVKNQIGDVETIGNQVRCRTEIKERKRAGYFSAQFALFKSEDKGQKDEDSLYQCIPDITIRWSNSRTDISNTR